MSVDLTVTVPQACAARLAHEALHDLTNAGENVAEAATWYRERRDSERLDGADLPRMREADRTWRQVRGGQGELRVTGSRPELAALLRSCVHSVADDIRDEIAGAWTPDAIRPLIHELAAWLDVFEAHGLGAAPPAGGRG